MQEEEERDRRPLRNGASKAARGVRYSPSTAQACTGAGARSRRRPPCDKRYVGTVTATRSAQRVDI